MEAQRPHDRGRRRDLELRVVPGETWLIGFSSTVVSLLIEPRRLPLSERVSAHRYSRGCECGGGGAGRSWSVSALRSSTECCRQYRLPRANSVGRLIKCMCYVKTSVDPGRGSNASILVDTCLTRPRRMRPCGGNLLVGLVACSRGATAPRRQPLSRAPRRVSNGNRVTRVSFSSTPCGNVHEW